MLAFLRLIRLPNLLIMIFIMCMMRWFLIAPWLGLQNCVHGGPTFELQMGTPDFLLLVLSVILIGAAGYIINDYFDVRIDKLNRPDTNVIDRGVKRRWAIVLHTAFNIIGVLLGLFLSWKYQMLSLGLMLFIGAPTLLWFYSIDFKRRPLAGNIVIALLSGMVPLLVSLFEIPALNRAYRDLLLIGAANFGPVISLTYSFALFAFVISLLREIIKDIEDHEGDRAYGCRTLPIALGIARTKWIVAGLTVVFMICVGWFQKNLVADANPSTLDWLSFAWFTVLVQLPLAFLLWRILKAKDKKDYRFGSLLTKLIMIAGASYLFLFPHVLEEVCSPLI